MDYLTTEEHRSHNLLLLTSPPGRALHSSLPAPFALLKSIPYPNSGLCTTPEFLSSGRRGHEPERVLQARCRYAPSVEPQEPDRLLNRIL